MKRQLPYREVTGVIKVVRRVQGYGFIRADNGMRGCAVARHLVCDAMVFKTLMKAARRLRSFGQAQGPAGISYPLDG